MSHSITLQLTELGGDYQKKECLKRLETHAFFTGQKPPYFNFIGFIRPFYPTRNLYISSGDA